MPFDDPDLNKSSGLIGADEHRHRIVLHEVTFGELECVEYRFVRYTVPVGTVEDSWLGLHFARLLVGLPQASCAETSLWKAGRHKRRSPVPEDFPLAFPLRLVRPPAGASFKKDVMGLPHTTAIQAGTFVIHPVDKAVNSMLITRQKGVKNPVMTCVERFADNGKDPVFTCINGCPPGVDERKFPANPACRASPKLLVQQIGNKDEKQSSRYCSAIRSAGRWARAYSTPSRNADARS